MATPTDPSRLRVTRHGYDPEDVHALLGSARARLLSLSERLRRAEDANVAMVTELRRWKQRARRAEAEQRRLEEALAAAESTVATSVAEVQVRADHLVERARCEARHLTMQAEEQARRMQEEADFQRLAAEAQTWFGADGPAGGDPDEDQAFARFMSDEIADEPSREWVLGHAG